MFRFYFAKVTSARAVTAIEAFLPYFPPCNSHICACCFFVRPVLSTLLIFFATTRNILWTVQHGLVCTCRSSVRVLCDPSAERNPERSIPPCILAKFTPDCYAYADSCSGAVHIWAVLATTTVNCGDGGAKINCELTSTAPPNAHVVRFPMEQACVAAQAQRRAFKN